MWYNVVTNRTEPTIKSIEPKLKAKLNSIVLILMMLYLALHNQKEELIVAKQYY